MQAKAPKKEDKRSSAPVKRQCGRISGILAPILCFKSREEEQVILTILSG
jgi:hypothetical protein